MFSIHVDTNFTVNYKRYSTQVKRETSQLAALKITKKAVGKYMDDLANRTRLAIKLVKQNAPVDKRKRKGKHLYQTVWGRSYKSKNGLRIRCIVSVGADYAPYVEFGTRAYKNRPPVPPNPFFRRSIYEAFRGVIPRKKLEKAISYKFKR